MRTSNASSCRFRHCRSIPIAAWRRTSAPRRPEPRRLFALAAGQARIVVASAAALMPRLAPPSAVQALSMMIRPGQDIPPDLLVSILADGGYERQDPGRRTRRVLPARRHPGHLPRRRGGALAAGVRRRHRGIAPPLRPRQPALGRIGRSVPARSGARLRASRPAPRPAKRRPPSSATSAGRPSSSPSLTTCGGRWSRRSPTSRPPSRSAVAAWTHRRCCPRKHSCCSGPTWRRCSHARRRWRS